MEYDIPIGVQTRIILLKSDPKEKYSQVNYIEKSLRKRGHKVLAINSVVPRIPWFNNDNYVLLKLKSILLYFWIAIYSFFFKPDIIMNELSIALVPFLKFFTSAKIIQLHSNLVDEKKWEQLAHPNHFYRQCYGWADEIIVPNKEIARIMKERYLFDKEPFVLYPCIDIPTPPWKIEDKRMESFYQNSQVSLCVIDMLKANSMFIVLEALIVLQSRLTLLPSLTPKLMFVLKNFDENSPKHVSKMRIVHATKQYKNITNNVFVFTTDDEVQIHSLIMESASLINTGVECYDNYMMLAMKYCKVIISTDQSGFGREIISNGYTGFLVKNEAEGYAKAIACLAAIPNVTNSMKCMQLLEYRCKYEYRKFAINCNKFVIDTTANVNMLFADDIVYHAGMRSEMFILRHCLASFYITQINNLPILFHHPASKDDYRAQYAYVQGWMEHRTISLATTIEKVAHFNTQYMEIELDWESITVTNHYEENEQEDAIGNYVHEAIVLLRRRQGNKGLREAVNFLLCNNLCKVALTLE